MSDVMEHVFELPAPATVADHLRTYDNIADYVVRLPHLFKAEQPARALAPIVKTIDTIGERQDRADIDPRDEARISAFDEIARIVISYLPSDGGTAADALRNVEQVILGDRARAAVA